MIVTVPSRVALLALCAMLGGCQTLFDAVGVTVPLKAGQDRVYNGSYQGRITQVAANGPGCPREGGERVIMVGDGVLWYAYTPATLFESPVAYDGRIEADSGAAHMVGRVTGNHLVATVKTPQCETRLSMYYVYNHGT